MVIRVSVLSALLVAVVAASVPAQTKGKVYKTPQEVFDASKAAAKKGDMKAYLALVEPESVTRVAAGLALTGVSLRGRVEGDKTGEAKKQLKPLFDAMDTHGLTAEATKKLKPITPDKDMEKMVKAAKPLLDLIKDKPGFSADALKAIHKISKKDDSDFKVLANAKLKDVKIDGDKATGTVVNTIEDKEKSQPITFVKVGKGWLIKLDLAGKAKDKSKDD